MSGIIGKREVRGSGVVSREVTYTQAEITGLGAVTSGTISTGAVVDDPTMTQGSDATGDVYYRAASGKLTRLATGADGTVLTSTGAGAVPAFEAATSAWVLLQTETGETETDAITMGSASLFSTTYRTYKIIGSNVKIETDDQSMDVFVSIGGSISTSSYYYWVRMKFDSGDVTANTQDEAEPKFTALIGNGIGNVNGERLDFEMTVYDPADTANWTTLDFRATTGLYNNRLAYVHGSGGYFVAAACTGIQFKPSLGGITSGYFKLYGLT